jgi:hypothetical protein
MADPLRHRQTKGAATDMVDLTPPRHIPTLPQGAEPIAKGNCVAAMRGGEEAGGKSGSRRTDIGYKASAVGQPGDGRGRPILLPSRARVDPAVAPRKCSVLPWETSPAFRANRSRVSVTAPDGRGGVSRGHSSAHRWGRREGLNL